MIHFQGYIDSLFANSAAIIAESVRSWRVGIDYEIDFWSDWFQTRGREWPDEYVARIAPRQLAPWLVALLPSTTRPLHILDVGAGPVTANGQFLEGCNIVLTAVDPLSLEYDFIMKEHSIVAPVRTQLGFAEDLSARFPTEHFDLVTCQNALDHAIEPAWGIVEMLLVCAPNSAIFLAHRRNEAEFENYTGFHQWNFDVTSEDFIIWNRSRKINITQMLAGIASVQCTLHSDYLNVTIRKTTPVLPLDILQYHRRLRSTMLESLLVASRSDRPGNQTRLTSGIQYKALNEDEVYSA